MATPQHPRTSKIGWPRAGGPNPASGKWLAYYPGSKFFHGAGSLLLQKTKMKAEARVKSDAEVREWQEPQRAMTPPRGCCLSFIFNLILFPLSSLTSFQTRRFFLNEAFETLAQGLSSYGAMSSAFRSVDTFNVTLTTSCFKTHFLS